MHIIYFSNNQTKSFQFFYNGYQVYYKVDYPSYIFI